MTVKKIIAGSLALATMLSALSCGSSKHSGKSSSVLPGTWQAQPVVIDGDSKDWPSPYPNYDAKAMVAYATSNDRQNLYITMETGDEMTQMKILKQGMIVSIDTTGKKEQVMNISYPLPNDDNDLDMLSQPTGDKKDAPELHTGKKMNQKIAKLIKGANQFSLDGFKGCNSGYMISQTTACGIKISMSMDEYKELVWEAVIPFKTLYNKDSISAADAGRPISVCFALKGLKKAAEKNVDNNGIGTNTGSHTNGMGGGGGRGGHGGGHGGHGAGAVDPMQHLYESTKTWKHFGIAYQ